MSSGRPAPSGKLDAVYERLIEIQMTQAGIAKEQAQVGISRDQIMSKIAILIENATNLMRSHEPIIASISDGVEHLPELIEKKIEQRNRGLILWVGVAAFLGTATGTAIHDWLTRLLG